MSVRATSNNHFHSLFQACVSDALSVNPFRRKNPLTLPSPPSSGERIKERGVRS